MKIKNIVRNLLINLHLDVSQNIKYDRLTKEIMKRELRKGSNCIDVGCHKGEILQQILHYSPDGQHFAFEPLPDLYATLETEFKGRAHVFPYALSETDNIQTTFTRVVNAPAYSGLRRRNYDDIRDVQTEEIQVPVRRLDHVVTDIPIHFIKIDVEGGDYNVLQGAEQILEQYHPLLLFEFGKGGADYYGVTPADMYHLLVNQHGYNIFTLQDFTKQRSALTLLQLDDLFTTGKEYYFVASCKK